MPSAPPLLDLSQVEEDRRTGVWALRAPSLLPGVSLSDMPSSTFAGQIRSLAMGCGSLWSVLSAPAMVSYSPSGGEASANISLLMQMEGSTAVGQHRRSCTLNVGDLCLIDERFPFHIQSRECNGIAFLRMPRRGVLGRHPHLEHQTAEALDPADLGASLLRELLIGMLNSAPSLGEVQRACALAAAVQLLGAASPRGAGAAEPNWRVRSALAYIEMNLAEAGLTAERVAMAQRISRRRLDHIMQSALGVTLTAQIWNRRLDQAAADLANPARRSHTVSQVGFASGFEDPAHFSRAFKARFGCTPGEWRTQNRAQAV